MIILYLMLFILFTLLCIPIQALNNIYFAPKIEAVDYSKYPQLTREDIQKLSCDNREVYGHDAAKFVGMEFYASENKAVWQYIRDNFFDRLNFSFVRYKHEEKAFSGDMASGLFLAIEKARKLDIISSEDKEFIGKALFNATVAAWLPFRFKHNDLSRGWLLLPPLCNGTVMLALVMLKLGFHFNTGIKKYVMGLFYLLFLLPSCLLFLVGTSDRCMFLGRIFLFWTYSTHSDALVYATAYSLKIPFARLCINRNLKRHGYNIDTLALATEMQYDYLISKNNVNSVDVADLILRAEGANKMLYHFMLSRNNLPALNAKKYFDLRKWEIRELNEEYIQTARCQDYSWERSPLERGHKNENDNDLCILFSWWIFDRVQNKVLWMIEEVR